MRILFQYLSGGGGGLSNIILLLGAYAREFPGDELIVVCSRGSDLEQLSPLPNVTLVTIPLGRAKEWTRFRLGMSGLRRLAATHRPDAVWSLNLGAYRRLPVPNLLAVNNPHQVYPLAITRLHPGTPLRAALLRFFFRRSLAVADAALLQTPLMADYLRKVPGAPRRVFVVPKAVEGEADVRNDPLPAALAEQLSRARDRGGRLWLYVSTALPHKNHAMILTAFDELARRESHECLVLTISAGEAEAIGGARATALLGSGRVIAAGWVRKHHLRALYGACDACVMPSLLESLSSAHLEAMEWGKPQIAADLPYARDLCGDAALYVPAETPVAWADAIADLSGDAARRDDLVTRGKARIAEFPPTWNECARRVRDGLAALL